jgi:hypothetical protein
MIDIARLPGEAFESMLGFIEAIGSHEKPGRLWAESTRMKREGTG